MNTELVGRELGLTEDPIFLPIAALRLERFPGGIFPRG